MKMNKLLSLLVCLGLLFVVVIGGVAASGIQSSTDRAIELQQAGHLPGDATLHTTDNRTGGTARTQDADIQIQSIAAPENITTSEDLTVEYPLENVGNANGTERFVDLKVNGTDSDFDDTDENVAVPAEAGEDLGGGGTAGPTATIDTDQLVPGTTYHVAVVTGDDSVTVTVDAVAP